MKQVLSSIAKIQSGIYEKPHGYGEVYYIQSGSITSAGGFNLNSKPELPFAKKTPKHLLQKGDILVICKGNNNWAVVYDESLTPAVASTTFIVIRVNSETVLPDYVAWFINLKETQNQLRLAAKGTSLSSITISDLENLELTILPVAKQKQIVEVNILSKKERYLLNTLAELKGKLTQQTLLKALNS